MSPVSGPDYGDGPLKGNLDVAGAEGPIDKPFHREASNYRAVLTVIVNRHRCRVAGGNELRSAVR